MAIIKSIDEFVPIDESYTIVKMTHKKGDDERVIYSFTSKPDIKNWFKSILNARALQLKSGDIKNDADSNSSYMAVHNKFSEWVVTK